jgi:hypothetical protein
LHRQILKKGEKKMKRLLTSLLLTLCLSSSVLAGEIPTVGVTPPPPPPDGMQTTTSSGEIPTGGITYEIADTALDFIQMVLSAGI